MAKKRADAIFASDLHLGEKQPLCRTDDFASAQQEKLEWLERLSTSLNAPVLVAGDIGDKPVISSEPLAHAAAHMHGMYGVAGQHDLPGHSVNNLPRCSLGVLVAAGVFVLLDGEPVELPCGAEVVGASWGEELPEGGDILVAHRFVYYGRAPWPGCPDSARATHLLKEARQPTIVTGDNHVPFTHKTKGGRLLVNPGSMMRRRADQISHRPRVYLWDAETNEVQPEYFPAHKGVITREHIDPKNELDERVSDFIARLDREYEVGLSFERNLDRFLRENEGRVSEAVRFWIDAARQHYQQED